MPLPLPSPDEWDMTLEWCYSRLNCNVPNIYDSVSQTIGIYKILFRIYVQSITRWPCVYVYVYVYVWLCLSVSLSFSLSLYLSIYLFDISISR